MALLGILFATIFASVWFELIAHSESDTKTETNRESNPESCHNQVPSPDVQEATGRTHITPQPVVWKPERASALLPDSTASMDKNTERPPVDHFPATMRITEEYVKNLENDNQNLKNEIGVCQDRFQNVSAMLHGVDEIVEEKEKLQDEVKSLKDTLAKYESDSRNQEKQDDSGDLKHLKDENFNLKTELEMSGRTVSFQSDEIQELTDTTNELTKKLRNISLKNDELTQELATIRDIKTNQEKQDSDELTQLKDENSKLKTELEMSGRTVSLQLEEIQNLTSTTNELNEKLKETILQYDELLMGRDVASKDKVAADESDSEKTQPQDREKPDDNAELIEQLRHENANLKTNLETSACMMSFQSEEIKNLTARTNELNNKLQRIALKNDELILKLAASRDMALTITDGFHETESKLEKEIKELKDQLNAKQKILEEREVALESTLQANKIAAQKVEEIQKSELEHKLAYQKNLVLTSLNDQLENELIELKRTMEQIRAEFRFLSEARDATSLSAEEARKSAEEARQLADERAAANGLLQSNVTQLNKELAASLSQIDEFKKEKAVQLYNASTWAATESQLRHEVANLKATIETQNETLSSNMSELERIKHDDSSLILDLESVKATLAEKVTENEDLSIRNSDLEKDNSLLELKNDTLKKEAEDSWRNLKRMERLNQDLWNTRDEVLISAEQAEKLAKEQVEALSEALAALREALQHTKDSAEATKTERESMNSDATKTEPEDPKKGNWIKKLIAKRKTRESKYEDGYANLLETTGLKMVERAKSLKDHANNIKAKGKALKKKAKTLQK